MQRQTEITYVFAGARVGANFRQLLGAKVAMASIQAQTRASGQQEVLAFRVPVHASRHCRQTDCVYAVQYLKALLWRGDEAVSSERENACMKEGKHAREQR